MIRRDRGRYGAPADSLILVRGINHYLGSPNRADALPTDPTPHRFSCQPLPESRSAADQGRNASVFDMHFEYPPNRFAALANDAFGFQIAKTHHRAGIRTNQRASR